MQGGDPADLVLAKERLLSHVTVQEDGCWIAACGLTRQGYSRMMVNYELDLGHRWSYLIFKGPIPEGAVVRHTCDRPSCVCPDHLLAGSQSDNIRDAVLRGRYVQNRGGAKLTEDDVTAIRASTGRVKDLAARYGVCRDTIGKLRAGKTWAHVQG